MSVSPFSVDLKTSGVGANAFIPPRIVDPKTEAGEHKMSHKLMQNEGLNGRNSKMETEEKANEYVIVHSEQNAQSAEKLKHEKDWKGFVATQLCLKGPSDLGSNINVASLRGLYLLVDSSLCDILIQKRRLHDDVENFVEELEKAEKHVYLINQLGDNNHRFKNLFYQLPESCARTYREMIVTSGHTGDFNDSETSDSGVSDLKTDSRSENFQENFVPQVMDVQSLEQKEKMTPVDSVDIICKGTANLLSTPYTLEWTQSGSSAGTFAGNQLMDHGGGGPEDAITSRKDEKDAESLSDEVAHDSDSDETDDPPSDVSPVQIGSNNKMNVQWRDGQSVIARQEGNNNSISVSIVPPNTKSKTIVVITTNPSDPVLDTLLVKELTNQQEVINVSLRSLDASLVQVTKGSVVLEIEVKPGVKMDNVYVRKLMQTIFNDRIGEILPQGTKLDVDVEMKMVVPLDQLGQYVYLNPRDLHKNCVTKEMYEEKVKEVHQLERKLIQGILQNPKQDHILQKTLKNFISSVLTDFALTMATVQPVTSQHSSQETFKPIPEEIPLTAPGPPSGMSRRVDSGYSDIAPVKSVENISRETPSSPVGIEFAVKERSLNQMDIKSVRYDACIIHAEDDTEFVYELKDFLDEEHGITCFSFANFEPGELRYLILRNVLKASQNILLIVSKNLKRDPRYWFNDGILYTEMERRCQKLLPILIDDSPLPVELRSLYHIDTKKSNWRKILLKFFKGQDIKESFLEQVDVDYHTGIMEEKLSQIRETAGHLAQLGDNVYTCQSGGGLSVKPAEVQYEGHGGQSEHYRKLHTTEHIARKLAEIGDDIGAKSSDVMQEVNFVTSDKEKSNLTALEQEILTDIVNRNKDEQYEYFRRAVHKNIGSDTSWTTMALLFQATKNVVSHLSTQMASSIKEFALKFVEDEYAAWIMNQGGWESVLSDDEDSDFDVD